MIPIPHYHLLLLAIPIQTCERSPDVVIIKVGIADTLDTAFITVST